MVKGIGVDLVDLSAFRGLCEGFGPQTAEPCPFVRGTFTDREIEQARGRGDACQYLAGRLAAKKAVFKAVAPLTVGGFDMRRVETIDAPSGQPVVSMGGALADACAAAGVREILVSITNESGLVEAIALAQ